jgi:hypothetical protein
MTKGNGVIRRLRVFFLSYPNSNPRTACRAVGLDPRKYGPTARKVKCLTRKALFA